MSRYEKVEDAALSDPGSDDDAILGRTSTEVRRDDQQMLEGEEEADRLLAEGRGLPREKSSRRRDKAGLRSLRRASRRQRRHGNASEEDGELLYEMEEGDHRDMSEASSSSELDHTKMEDMQFAQQPSKPRIGRIAGIHVVIAIAFVGFLYGAFHASRAPVSGLPQVPLTLSNGTTNFAPTTILISLDGFRADFLHRNLTPNLNALIQSGVSPKYMLPSFPSVTFPNHFTLVTGLYPESHGVVGNTFWDPALLGEFYYTDPARSMQPQWWTAEPVWETLEYAGVRTAIHMWPGSEAHIGTIEPAFVDRYNGKEALSNKVNRALGWLDLPGHDDPSADERTPRPQLIALYVPNVDADGHLYGPNSTEIRQTIFEADAMIGDLMSGLDARNLTDIVNVVVVSDHGMASTDVTRLVELNSIVDTRLIEHTDGWPLYGLRPKDNADLEGLYDRLKNESRASGHFEVYLKDKDMPERYHFSKNERIAPLWIVPETGWAIVNKHEYDEAMSSGVYHPRGIHGYDHEHPLMRAIFIARGPAFPHMPGSSLDVFQNIEVYNIVCDSVGVAPRPNNGTLRLPLKPNGVHTSPPPDEIPDDPAAEPIGSPAETPVPSQVAGEDVLPTRPIVQENSTESNIDGESTQDDSWWDWVQGKVDGVKDWASSLFDKVQNATSPDPP